MPNNNKSSTPVYHLQNIESFIIELRNQKVILDSHVALIYGVETKRINEAVQRNLEKFPQGYILELNKQEWQSLRLQHVISMAEDSKEPLKSQNVTSMGGKEKLLINGHIPWKK